ncbi:thioredoxin family protein [Furfurilactobacillus sp. WILCCON 0119]
MTPMENLSNAELAAAIKQPGKKMLFFTATWCPDCAFIKPVMPDIESKYDQYQWLHVDRDANLDFAQELGVMGIPSFVAFEDGQELGRFANADRKTRAEVESFINTLEGQPA